MTSIAEFLGARRGEPGVSHAQVLGRAGRDEPQVVAVEDLADDNAVRMSMAGYQAGTVLDLTSQISVMQDQIDVEARKIARAEAASRRVMALHAAGQITAMDIVAMQPEDSGDPERLQVLQERLYRTRQALGEAQGTVSRAAGMVERMSGDWQGARAARSQQDRDWAALERHRAEVEPVMRRMIIAHHERGAARELAARQLTRQAKVRRSSGTGWPAEISRSMPDAFVPEFDPAA